MSLTPGVELASCLFLPAWCILLDAGPDVFLRTLGTRRGFLMPFLGVSDSELTFILWIYFSQGFHIRTNSCLCSVCADALTTLHALLAQLPILRLLAFSLECH